MNYENECKDKEYCLPSKDIIVDWYEEAKRNGIVTSWRQFARKANVNPAILSSWQTEGRLPGDDTIYALAEALGKDAKPLLQAVIRERSDRSKRQLIDKYGDMAAVVLTKQHNGSEWESFMALLDSLSVGFFVLDLEARSFLNVNNYLCELLRVKDKASIVGHELTELFDVDGNIFPHPTSDDVPVTSVFQIQFGSDKVQLIMIFIACWQEGKHLSVGLLKKTENRLLPLSDNVIKLIAKDI